MSIKTYKGAILVALGASSYGALATVVKLAYERGFNTAEVTTAQFSIGFIAILILNTFRKRDTKENTVHKYTPLKLMMAGTSMGLTSIFYYFSVKYIPVSVAIVLLMQSVWMGIFLEAILDRKAPSARKLMATLIVLTGTALATSIFTEVHALDWRGIAWGLAAGMSYTCSLYASNGVAVNLHPTQRSMWLLAGGLSIIVLTFATTSYQQFNFHIFWPWGLFLAFFGTILPPMLFTRGMPLTGIGLGTIVASLELPVSVGFAYVLLSESIDAGQWLGIGLIIFAVIFMNIKSAAKP